MRATYLIGSLQRPALLQLCIAGALASVRVEGWELGCVVAVHEGDPGAEVARAAGVELVELPPAADDLGPGRKYNAALSRALDLGADVLLVTGDDDIPSPRRAAASILAHCAGAPVAGSSAFRFVHWETWQTSIWLGPAWRNGALLSYSADVLAEVDGWDEASPRDLDWKLQQSIERRFGVTRPAELCDLIGRDSVCGHGSPGGNISTERVFPPQGEIVGLGAYQIIGGPGLWEGDELAPLQWLRELIRKTWPGVQR